MEKLWYEEPAKIWEEALPLGNGRLGAMVSGNVINESIGVNENGRSQAVRLPKECRFNTDEVAVNRIGDIVLLMPKTNKWSSFMQAIDMFSDDFMQDGRDSSPEQEREAL